MEHDYESESRADRIVNVVAVVICLIASGLFTLYILFLWSIESHGFFGDQHNEHSLRALFLLGLLCCHLVLMGFMLFARRLAFQLMLGLTILELCAWAYLAGFTLETISAFLCPLSNIIFLVITLWLLKKDPTKQTGGFEVIVKAEKK
jgi:hypothetical protein